MLLNSAGELEELACFERDINTEIFQSCSVNWKNQLFVFGGENKRKQISRLSGYKLERVGNLTFKHYDGACSVMGNEYIFLCFSAPSADTGMDDYLQCRRSTGPLKEFSELDFSIQYHMMIQTSCSDSKL